MGLGFKCDAECMLKCDVAVFCDGMYRLEDEKCAELNSGKNDKVIIHELNEMVIALRARISELLEEKDELVKLLYD